MESPFSAAATADIVAAIAIDRKLEMKQRQRHLWGVRRALFLFGRKRYHGGCYGVGAACSYLHFLGEIPYTFLKALEKCSWFGYPTAFPISPTDKLVSFKSSAAFVMR